MFPAIFPVSFIYGDYNEPFLKSTNIFNRIQNNIYSACVKNLTQP